MKAQSERLRLIKDPFYSDLTFMDFEPVLKDINKYRRTNELYTEVEESELIFDKQKYICDYTDKIGANKPFLKANDSELWYYANLKTIAYLKANGCVWEWESLSDSEYITNDFELCNKVYEDDLINQANDQTERINNAVWKFGGRYFGSNFMEVSTIEINSEMVKFWTNIDGKLEFKAGFEPSEDVKNILEKIKKEVE